MRVPVVKPAAIFLEKDDIDLDEWIGFTLREGNALMVALNRQMVLKMFVTTHCLASSSTERKLDYPAISISSTP
ncbi:hypothetical protein TRIUR3_26808 [Triticum urartu]|uniref:Uncharacterized protein n=1 Tax=Triticum urartu TaxID=4572 RepID=M7YZT8_TRIUA|nr:hypothetical protein TRIUR3_26808 [Triticum urartu]